jgi:REP element-mobilizing transposase RayT
LGAVIGSFKSAVSKRINQNLEAQGSSIWQRNYYEHIIRNDKDLNRIRLYIHNNPANWNEDFDIVSW